MTCDILDFACWYNTLGDWVYRLLYGIFNPIFSIVDAIISGFLMILSDIIGVITDILKLGLSTVTTFLNNTIFTVLPVEWVAIISTGIFIIVFFRIYSFIKGIEIFGFKIG